jgi:hypothetical protein
MTYEVPLYNQVNFELEAYNVPTYNEVEFEIGEEDSVVGLPLSEMTLTTYSVTAHVSKNKVVNIPTVEITITSYPVDVFAENPKTVNLPSVSIELTSYDVTATIIERIDREVDLPVAELGLTTYNPTIVITKDVTRIWFDKANTCYVFQIRNKNVAELDILGNLRIKGKLTEEQTLG